jgi:type I restriction enzyme S subunit
MSKLIVFEPENLKYVSTKFHEKLSKSRLTPGDIVVVRSGYVGISCVIPSTLLDANCSDLVIVRPAEYLISEYGSLFLNSNYAKSRINNVKVGIAQSHFNVGAMKKILIPLAPRDEQEQIVTKVLALLSASEELEKNVNKSIKMADLLKKAILANAFSGKLVPQNPDNEPAQKLLERIRAEHFRNKSKSGPQLELSQYVK